MKMTKRAVWRSLQPSKERRRIEGADAMRGARVAQRGWGQVGNDSWLRKSPGVGLGRAGSMS
jgi:hypothetical protein